MTGKEIRYDQLRQKAALSVWLTERAASWCKGGDSVSSQKVHDAIKEAFNEKGSHPKTIVFDNGSEFAKFRELETALQTSIYFADIHSPWQRGSNENINGCLRFFLPRGMDFRNLEDGYLETVVSLLNNRPRKCLGVKSPHEVFYCI